MSPCGSVLALQLTWDDSPALLGPEASALANERLFHGTRFTAQVISFPGAKFIGKTDDDSYNILPNLAVVLRSPQVHDKRFSYIGPRAYACALQKQQDLYTYGTTLTSFPVRCFLCKHHNITKSRHSLLAY